MNRKSIRQLGKPALEIIEEAVHLLRMAPVRILAAYYIGALPFVLGFLYFWADMSRPAFAYSHCAEAALGVSVLFLWMKCWQAVFACNLKAHVCGEPPPRWTLRRTIRLAFVQTVIQPSLLFVMPFAMLVVLPMGWDHAFYHSVTAIGDGETADAKTVFKRSWQQSMLWQRQNHITLCILSLLGVFAYTKDSPDESGGRFSHSPCPINYP